LEASKSTLFLLLKAMRPHHWLKNGLIFLPAALAHIPPTFELAIDLAVAFISFSLLASAVYLVNDRMDVEADRLHPTKRHRPFASGALSVSLAAPAAFTLSVISLTTSYFTLPAKYWFMLVGYLILNLLYTRWLKRVLLVDVFLLAGLYTWRLLAGGEAIDIDVSEWLLAMSAFAFTSLAFVKRFTELRESEGSLDQPTNGRGYGGADVGIMRAVGPATGYMAVLVFALYLNSQNVIQNYEHPKALWLLVPLLMYWFTRLWFLTNRGEVHDDPLVFVLRDAMSLLVIGLMVMIGVVASIPF
jgi:4-hydroxybenzoate polyprenyltransferase